ncbi:MAG: glycosyltransferase family 4 protein [Cyclobacteriaceae bacterium]|nr:glycosyltransferase family 4 protein [Cyclobacteriaceae bacterium]
MKDKKKVLIFLGSLTSGGTERVVSSLSRYLADESYKVMVVTLDSAERDFYRLDEKVHRIAMNAAGDTAGLGKILDNLRRVFQFRNILNEQKPDILLGMITRHAVISLIASVGLPVKVAVSERNYPEKRKNHSMWEFLRSVFYRFADMHVVQTKKIAEWVENNAGAKNVKVIPNSISWPIARLEPILKPDDYLQHTEKLILAAGTFKHQKGFDLLLKTAVKLLPDYSGWKLVILGEEKNESESNGIRAEFEKIIADYGLTDRILLPGRAGNIGDWFDAADIFVLSSRFEGFPNVLLEAMASGCASVSFDCDTGPSDLIRQKKNGILVPPGDTELLETEIRLLIENPLERVRISENAIAVRELYSEDKILTKWSKVFEELVSSEN